MSEHSNWPVTRISSATTSAIQTLSSQTPLVPVCILTWSRPSSMHVSERFGSSGSRRYRRQILDILVEVGEIVLELVEEVGTAGLLEHVVECSECVARRASFLGSSHFATVEQLVSGVGLVDLASQRLYRTDGKSLATLCSGILVFLSEHQLREDILPMVLGGHRISVVIHHS